ncbi:ankyrin repeat domain-containing protein [Paenarthrobacter sp. NPDC090520]|uniref:ankyrin repeat domain-containing protein n=1 Tax=Paenarthrobacter sp. NPDC090520 TaxID=3364382 RepID=UPI00380EAE72
MDRAGRTPLHYAAMTNDVPTIKELIDQGELVSAQDKQGFTPLHFAAQEYSVAAASDLLRAGAQVDLKNAFGNTALFVAVANSRGRGELIRLLRSHGADPLQANASGQTPLGFAELIGNYNVVEFFRDLRE